MFENPSRGRQAKNFTTNAPKILDLKSSSEQIFSRKLPLGAPVKCLKLKRVSSYFAFPRTILGLIYISLLDARLSGTCLLMSACCNSGRTFIYKQSVGDLTLVQFLKHAIIPQKRQVFHYKYSKTPHWRFQKKAKS